MDEQKPSTFYVATAIPYVNAKPHIGNAMDYMLADVLARYYTQQDIPVFFGVGSDEHGNKIAAKAAEAGLTPQQYTDQMVPAFHDMLNRLNISYTDFIRTSEARHETASQYIWQKLQPYIYKGTYEGWYCVGCESFVTAKQATENNGVCPDHKQPYVQLSEENYYFRLSAFTEHVKQAIESDTLKIQPTFRKKEILNLLNHGLEDISISRPRKNLSWGIPVPNDPNHVMYVWFEALINYVSILGYPDGPLFARLWPANVQVIGKDILRFHAAIWPAMLIGLGLPLPKKLLVHGFVNVGGAKMSKTVGNVVDPIQIADEYGVDAFRYFFLRHIPTLDDGDFTWEKFETAYNTELGNELGNLVQRVASMVVRYQNGMITQIAPAVHDTAQYQAAMTELRLNDAFDAVWDQVRQLNVYLEEVKPWALAKAGEKEASHLNEVLAYAAGSLVHIADLLLPFLPDTAESIRRTFTADVITTGDVLFPKIYKHTPDPKLTHKTPAATASRAASAQAAAQAAQPAAPAPAPHNPAPTAAPEPVQLPPPPPGVIQPAPSQPLTPVGPAQPPAAPAATPPAAPQPSAAPPAEPQR
ncbi:methionine--tRNA ligase [Candidatus Saccharibacteria bacterium]|nr:methionine--tRNA ligase [Candidatus Saccharibacteria bacterium]